MQCSGISKTFGSSDRREGDRIHSMIINGLRESVRVASNEVTKSVVGAIISSVLPSGRIARDQKVVTLYLESHEVSYRRLVYSPEGAGRELDILAVA